MPLLRWKPPVVQASIEVAGEGVFPRMFMAPKSVWVSSFDGGPRSWVEGGLDFEDAGGGVRRGDEIDKPRRHLAERETGFEPCAMLCREGRATMRCVNGSV